MEIALLLTLFLALASIKDITGYTVSVDGKDAIPIEAIREYISQSVSDLDKKYALKIGVMQDVIDTQANELNNLKADRDLQLKTISDLLKRVESLESVLRSTDSNQDAGTDNQDETLTSLNDVTSDSWQDGGSYGMSGGLAPQVLDAMPKVHIKTTLFIRKVWIGSIDCSLFDALLNQYLTDNEQSVSLTRLYGCAGWFGSGVVKLVPSKSVHISFCDQMDDNIRKQQRVRRGITEDRVAFSASIDLQQVQHQGQGQDIVFEHVITNVGNAYNENHGTFIAPVAGIYLFYYSLHSPGARANLAVNGSPVVNLYIGNDQASQMVIVSLNQGDDVSVQNKETDKLYWGGKYSTFSGVFLFEAAENTVIAG